MSASKTSANDDALAQLLAGGGAQTNSNEAVVDNTATLVVVSEVEMAEAR